MGDRGQVYIHHGSEPGVYLYTHWGASSLPATVGVAMRKRWCWDDWEYLARIVFEEMISADRGGETGFGIGTSLHDDVWRVVDVDCGSRRVHIDDVFDGTFEQFIAFSDMIPG
jgi:hypothetical protein